VEYGDDMSFAYTILYVPDVERAAAFYETVFGLERGYVDPAGDYLALQSGSTTLSFAREGFVAGNGVRFETVRPDATPPGIEIGFEVDDVAAVYQRAVTAGARPWYEPAKQPWGQTVSYVRDPNGFLVEIASPPPAKS
jgi:catechol 2,3-dioxygenase-like lactoylglutathione lyase family enzyme